MIKIQNYIGGEFVDPNNGQFMDNVNPATEEVFSKVPCSDSADAVSAIKAAKTAFSGWKELSVRDRANYLRLLAEKIKANFDELALAESMDNGKPLSVAKSVDIPRASLNLEYFAELGTQSSNSAFDMDGKAINYVLRQPHGVVTCISPWNLPLYLFTWKIAPALVFGNTVVAKPSEVTPFTAYMFSKICHEAGLPPGVLNVLHGKGADVGETITSHEDVRAVSFTGSTRTGEVIAKSAAPHFKKVSLEMGGKNPNIIFADCDYEKALSTSLRSSFANQGQICLCGSRIFVEKPIYDKFKADFVKRASELKVGDPKSPDSDLGAVVSREHFDKIMLWISKAKSEGGEILCGGESIQINGKGYFVKPTVIEGLACSAETNQTEIFGPVVTLIPFESEEEVLQMANGTEYGLAGSLWTKDIDRAHRIAREIDTGVFWVNTWMLRDLRIPFGGVKSSGLGREGGEESYRFFTKVKTVCVEIGG